MEGSTSGAPDILDQSMVGDYFTDCYFCNKPDLPRHLHIKRAASRSDLSPLRPQAMAGSASGEHGDA